MDSNKVITTYGECRCCLAKGQHRDMMKEYYYNGIREVYFDIFMECFNLYLSTNSLLSTLICSTCVQRLRDATSFRMMVASTERQLLNALENSDDKGTVFVNVLAPPEADTLVPPSNTIKIEVQTDDVKLEAVDIDAESVDYDDLVDDLVPDVTPDISSDRETAFLARFAHTKLPRLPTRMTLPEICPEFCRHLESLQEMKILPHNLIRLTEDTNCSYNDKPHKRSFVSEKSAHIVNTSTVLECSNVTPFKSKSRTGFPCFYCRNIFDNIEKLREHTNQHKKKEIKTVLGTYGAECLVVYVDVANLKCTLCDKNIKNMNELKSHLVNVHKKKMYPEFSDRVIPFLLSATGVYQCQICRFNFETFGSIERHMNVHYRNYVCKECGTGFVTKYRLKVHTKSMHSSGKFSCEICGKIFSTQQKHNNHVNTVHKMIKRFKCTKCPERFTEYFRRQKHLVEVHGVAPLRYKCNVCEKSFDRRYTLSRHMKRDHLEERDFQCDICTYSCFTRNELRVHMVKHNGERIFECAVCKKSYARKKTLKEHMRIHNNDRRFACAVCGQAFVQKCSLKGHLKTHHLEFSLQ